MRKYDNAYSIENLYGHVISLLGQHLPEGSDGAVHLDIASGYSAIGEVVEGEFGLHYVGVDIDPVALKAVHERGLEVHQADLAEPGGILAALTAVIAGRRVASVSVLDGLEHIADGSELLAAIRAIVVEHGAVSVFSLPNVTHRDVGYKLALGSWEYTPTGLLDVTHLRLYGEKSLREAFAAAGLYPIGRNDYSLAESDQHYPAGHPALQPGTNLNRFLNEMRDDAEPSGRVNQFVWACVAGPQNPVRHEAEPPGPFLTVVIRTQGRRIAELEEVLLCLAGQSSTDFEVIVIAHRTSVEQQLGIEGAVEGVPGWLAERIRIVHVDHGNRATLLNTGLEEACGRYVAALDDDDLVFAHWVQAFADLELKFGGRVLRSVCARQQADRVRVREADATRAHSGITMPYAREFSFVEHLSLNSTPFMSAAIPRALHRDLGMRYDDTLTTTEDWDYLLRAVSVVGVADSGALTAVYRGWVSQDSSITEHVHDEWILNQYAVDRKLDARPVLLPAGETRAIRKLVRQASAAADAPPPARPEHDVEAEVEQRTRARVRERDDLHLRVVSLLESRSWRASAGIRAVGLLTGRGRPIKASKVLRMSDEQLREVIAAIESSRSWRITKVLRRG
ncbi:methyltransferase domain-containing protein [Herbiconiux sp.]|uniref:methyltransferase domain-containing protein n=1 Tax=Herbiconiux sp. TaxID=1871186 RepID=UPI0025BE4A3A|nr:methyltransferase domain-containing protein [Herbiconiux sp.]